MSFKPFMTILLLPWLCSCASMSILTEHEPDVDLSDLETYRWAPERDLGIADPRIDAAEVSRIVERAIENELEARGYRLQEVRSDFLVDYHAIVEHKMVEAIAHGDCPPNEMDLVNIGATDRYCREYDQGTLIVDVLDPETAKVLWRGLARDEVDWRMSSTEMEKRITDAIGKILSRFPP